MIGSWNDASTHFTIRLFSIFRTMVWAFDLCCKGVLEPHCATVCFSVSGPQQGISCWMISCIFFSPLAFLQLESNREPSPFCETRLLVCVCVDASDPSSTSFHAFMSFCYSPLSSVLVWFILRMEVFFWRRAIWKSPLKSKIHLSEKQENLLCSNGKNCSVMVSSRLHVK